MRIAILGLLAMFSSACVATNDLEEAPSNFFEAELWEFESVDVPMHFVPSYVTSVYVEVTACAMDADGPGYLWVGTEFGGLEMEPRACSAGVDVERVWFETHSPHRAWMEVEPVYTRDATTIIATFRVIGW